MLDAAAEWAKQSPGDDFWVFAILMVALTVGSFVGAFIFFMRKRIIEDTPTSKVSSAAQGYTELTGYGKLMEGSMITGPLTGTTCTWYSYTIEEHRRSGKKSHWVTIDKGVSESLFLLVDDSGEAVIDPDKASVTPTITDVWYGHSRHPAPRQGNTKKKLFTVGGGRYRYTEKRMHPNDSLYAIGLFATVGGAGSASNIDSDVGHLLRQWKQNSEQLLADFDNNRDGQIDMEEWQKVREAAFKQVQKIHSQQVAQAPVHMLGKTCDSRRPYLLSALPQSDLVKRYSWYSSGLIVTFFVAGILATWMIGTRLSA